MAKKDVFKALEEYYTIILKDSVYTITCRKCGSKWGLEGAKADSFTIGLLNHAFSHKLSDNEEDCLE